MQSDHVAAGSLLASWIDAHRLNSTDTRRRKTVSLLWCGWKGRRNTWDARGGSSRKTSRYVANLVK
eukprot:1362385-Amphidinium_carterae.1